MTYLKEMMIRVSLISIVTVAHKTYGRATEISSCGLPRCGRILLAATTFDARLRSDSDNTRSRGCSSEGLLTLKPEVPYIHGPGDAIGSRSTDA
jgi:hypothetical protein